MSNITHQKDAGLPQKLGVEHLLPGQTAFTWRTGLEGRIVPVDRSAKPKDAVRVNPYSAVGRSPTMAEKVKTARIRGRSNDSRSQ